MIVSLFSRVNVKKKGYKYFCQEGVNSTIQICKIYLKSNKAYYYPLRNNILIKIYFVKLSDEKHCYSSAEIPFYD